MKINKNIEIIRTNNIGLSSLGLVSAKAMLDVLKRHYKSVTITTVNDLEDLEELTMRRPDLVFNGIKYITTAPGFDNRIWIADYLENHGIAVTGSGMGAHVLESDKFRAKQAAIAAGLSTSKYFIARQNKIMHSKDMHLSYPVFVKPIDKGGGVGIDNDSVAHTFGQMNAKVNSISKVHGSDSLIEEYLSGREFSVAILKDDITREYSIMPLELVAPINLNGDRILTHEIKSDDTETFTAVTSPAIRLAVNDLAIDVFHALGARDYGRIDIRMNNLGVPQFLEANLIPSLTKDFGNFPKACKLNMELGYETILLQIARLGFARANSGTDELYVDIISRNRLPVTQPLAV